MDPNSSLENICLGDDVIVISSDKVEGSGDWNSPKYQDTTVSKGKKVVNALSFYRMEPDEIIKLCLDYEVKEGKKLVKKELIVALKGELYFVKFIINPVEDDFEPGVILGRFILRTPPPSSRSYDWDQLLDFNFDDVPKSGEELPPFVRKMGKSNLEERAVIETLAYNDKYRRYLMNLKERWNLMNKTVKENEEAVKRIKGEALKEKDDPGAFIFPIRLEGKVNKNALADTGLGLYQVDELEEDGFNVYFEGGGKELGLRKSQICCGQFISKLARKYRVLTEDVVRSLSAPIYCRDLDTITLKDLIDSDGKLIPEDPQPGVPRVGIPIPPRASMQDLYDRMGRMEIRQDATERMEHRQSYH
ncbi:hypothetical protein Tco_0129400 [Tanacetum coccineum]